MKLQVEEPREKRRKTNAKNKPSPSPSPPPPSYSLLPDEIMANCLARIPRSYHPRLSIVSKTFMSLLSSTDLYVDRSNLGITEPCLYVCLQDPDQLFPQWFTLWINPNQTMHESTVTKKTKRKKKIMKQTRAVLVPIPTSKFPSTSKSIVIVGSEIYVIGGPVNKKPSSTLQILDCRSHTWRDAPSMNVARDNASSCFYDGKIYVMGGCKELKDDEPWAEVFDTKTQTWERLPDPGTVIKPKLDGFRIKGREGKIYINFVGNYDTKQDKWELFENASAALAWKKGVTGIVPYCYRTNIWLYNIKDERTEKVEGLDSLVEKHGGGVSTSRIVQFGGKLLLTWEESMLRGKKIWCAEIVLETRDGGEVWGNIEWVDVVHRGPSSWSLLHYLAVSV